MLCLANSTVMTQEGTYKLVKITPDDAKEMVNKFKEFKSYIGYPQTAEYMSKVLGVNVEVNREEMQLKDGDMMLVCKLKYRVKDPTTKGQEVSEDDFEWYLVSYSSTVN